MNEIEFYNWSKGHDAIRVLLVEVEDVDVSGVSRNFYLSSKPYVSGSADVPANTVYDACINGSVSFNESLSLDLSSNLSFSDIEVENLDGNKDSWLDYAWQSREVKVYIGDVREGKSTFYLAMAALVGLVTARSRDTINISLVPKLDRLNCVLNVDSFVDTEGVNKLIPLTFGECFNVTPVLKDAANYTYKFHNLEAEDVIEVRDNGYPVPITKNLALGEFTLKYRPYGMITASVQGAKTAGVYKNTAAELVKLIISEYGPATSKLPADIDIDNFNAFQSANTQPLGIYIADEVNKLEVCREILASVGATLVCTTTGKLRIVKLDIPLTADIHITDSDILSEEITVSDVVAPIGSHRLNYCKNWTPLEGSNLAAGISPTTLAIFEKEWFDVNNKNVQVLEKYRLQDTERAEDSLLLTQADADAESDRRLALWSESRKLIRVKCFGHLLTVQLGDAVSITTSRLGMDSGTIGLVVGASRDFYNSQLELEVLI